MNWRHYISYYARAHRIQRRKSGYGMKKNTCRMGRRRISACSLGTPILIREISELTQGRRRITSPNPLYKIERLRKEDNSLGQGLRIGSFLLLLSRPIASLAGRKEDDSEDDSISSDRLIVFFPVIWNS